MKWFFSAFAFTVFIFSCQNAANDSSNTTTAEVVQVAGETMGTTYHITYLDEDKRNFKASFDSLLVIINLEVSTYIDTSTISIFNQSEEGINLKNYYWSSDGDEATHNQHFITNFHAAKLVYKESEGAFNPTIMPLVNYWGFGYTPKRAVLAVDTLKVDSLMQFVDFEGVTCVQEEEETMATKTKTGTQLDFSALAKGYGVDALGRFLEHQNITNYLVEIGGETRCKGKNAAGEIWRIGINTPSEDAAVADFETIVQLENAAIATSGNYRNFYEVNGQKYAHTINPKTGFPEASNLLSASIFTDECMMADAYATTCMVMGLEQGKAFIESLDGVEALLIYADENGTMQIEKTTGMEKYLVKEIK